MISFRYHPLRSPRPQLEAKDKELKALKAAARSKAKQAETDAGARAAAHAVKAAALAARAKAFHKELLAGLAELGVAGTKDAADACGAPARGGTGATDAE
jgi:hypothetical protein